MNCLLGLPSLSWCIVQTGFGNKNPFLERPVGKPGWFWWKACCSSINNNTYNRQLFNPLPMFPLFQSKHSRGTSFSKPQTRGSATFFTNLPSHSTYVLVFLCGVLCVETTCVRHPAKPPNPRTHPPKQAQPKLFPKLLKPKTKLFGCYSSCGHLLLKPCCLTHLSNSQAFEPSPKQAKTTPQYLDISVLAPQHPTTVPQEFHHKGKLKCLICLQGLGSRLLDNHLGSHFGS